jgi:DNA repair exonuclease SbcCD ATPase subunit
MATEAEQQDGSTEDSSGEEQQDQQQQTTDDTSGNGEQQQVTPPVDKSAKLPDDHPVVKQLAADKAKLAAARSEIAELRAKSADVTKLEEELGKRPTTEALETLQTRYDRLEGFLQAVGGPLGKALDSRSFTRDLFETDKDIEDLVKAWNRANPSATSTALGASPADPGKGKMDPNTLLRIAAGKQ